ncbi:recombinase family protein [Elizabethkingia anophelis]|uniref:recombinase family protein n=1 Tax=Elizabethkingia anophelis TaxID=1117645 RepID=UPI00301C0166
MLAIYARVSQDKDDNQNSIETQVDLGKRYADKLGLNYDIYADNNISGTLEIENRPELFRMLQDIASEKITHIFAYDQSRLERNNVVWSNLYMLFQKNSIKLYFQADGDFDFESDSNFLTSNILSVFNSFYVKLTKKKVITALQRNVENGKVHAKPPFGYDKDENKLLIINNKESEIVKRIYKMSLEGKGTDKIAEILNYEGVLTAYSKLEKGGVYKIRDRYNPNIVIEKKKSDAKWRGRTIQGIIKNTIYMGKRSWKGKFYPAPAIFDEVYWQKVNENLKKNRNNTGKKVEHKYLLKGIIKCGCGKNMYGRSRVNKRDHTYICSSRRYKGESCGNKSINIDKIENLIWENFFIRKELLELLNNSSDNQNSLLEHIKQEEALLDQRIINLKKNKSNLIKAISNNIITDDDAKSEINNINNSLIKHSQDKISLASRIVDIRNFKSLIIDTRADFEAFSADVDFDTKRTLINKYIERIIISYDNGKKLQNGNTLPKHIYYIQIEFKNNIIKENYIYNIKNNVIISLRDSKFKLLSNEGIVDALDFTTLGKVLMRLSNGKVITKPIIGKDNQTIILSNTIIPYGDAKLWSIQNIVDFYTLNTTWLSEKTGINIITENKNLKSYQLLVKEYCNYKNKPLIDWVTFLYKTFGYNDKPKSFKSSQEIDLNHVKF